MHNNNNNNNNLQVLNQRIQRIAFCLSTGSFVCQNRKHEPQCIIIIPNIRSIIYTLHQYVTIFSAASHQLRVLSVGAETHKPEQKKHVDSYWVR